MSDVAIRRLAEKLERARASYPQSIKDRLSLGPTLAASELTALERHHRVSLPDDFREFLMRIGNGGCTAAGGMLSIQESLEGSDSPERPCPLQPHEDYAETWAADLGVSDSWAQGTIVLRDLGCGVSDRLVVAGPARGRLVCLDAATPVFLPDSSFLAWFERFLDSVLEDRPFS